MNAADVMTPDPITVPFDATVADAVRLMLERHVSGLPVVGPSGELLGIVTEGDLLRRSETGTEKHRPRWLEFFMGPGRLASDYVHTHARRLDEIMTAEVATVAPNATLAEVVELMERDHVKRVPVLEGNVCVGIVSRADLLRALRLVLETGASAVAGDDEIRERIEAELQRNAWGRGGITVTVRGGVVELEGVIFDHRERGAIRVAAENVPGVKEVADHLIRVEPNTGISLSAEQEEVHIGQVAR